MTGTRGYLGGWLDRRAGAIDPLAYTTELAWIAAAAGARIAEQHKVVRLRLEAGNWQVSVGSGAEFPAKSVVLASNAYTEVCLPGLAETIRAAAFVPGRHRAAPTRAGDAGSAGRPGSVDSRRILVYYRKSTDGRLMLGGGVACRCQKAPTTGSIFSRAMLRLYPALAGVAIEKRWFGRVAMTPDHLPHIHEPETGLLAALGCQGRGLGLMTALGKRFAAYLANADPKLLPFPVSPIRPLPFHAVRQVASPQPLAGIGRWTRW